MSLNAGTSSSASDNDSNNPYDVLRDDKEEEVGDEREVLTDT
jgi:hypothetical protein